MTALALPAPLHAALVQGVPVEPGAGQARQWLQDELAKQPYQAARPTPLDLASQAVVQWFTSLFASQSNPTPVVLLVVALLLVVVLLIVALVLFGLPRVNRRSRRPPAALFGDVDGRTAQQLREASRRAAAAGDHSLAVLEAFRGLARGLEERTLVSMFPGTTASGFAREAASAVPDEAQPLRAAAAIFDGIRYGNASGSEAQWQQITALDARCAAARPRLAEPVPAGRA